jgi:hypothetical protein
MFYPDPDPNIFSSRSRIRTFFSGSRILHEKWNANLSVLLSCRDPEKIHTGSGSRMSDSWGKKRHQIPVPDPQHWYNRPLTELRIFLRKKKRRRSSFWRKYGILRCCTVREVALIMVDAKRYEISQQKILSYFAKVTYILFRQIRCN